jgi:serine/threonine-protein kinase
VTLFDLPKPASDNARALAIYMTGLRAEHAASVDAAVRSYNEAVSLDPAMALAHMRLSRHEPRSLEARAHYQKAQQLRTTLSERDKAFLDAFEPVIQHEPPA